MEAMLLLLAASYVGVCAHIQHDETRCNAMQVSQCPVLWFATLGFYEGVEGGGADCADDCKIETTRQSAAGRRARRQASDAGPL